MFLGTNFPKFSFVFLKGAFLKSELIFCYTRGKEKLEQLPCEQFLQCFEISRAFHSGKQVREARDNSKPCKNSSQGNCFFFLVSKYLYIFKMFEASKTLDFHNRFRE